MTLLRKKSTLAKRRGTRKRKRDWGFEKSESTKLAKEGGGRKGNRELKKGCKKKVETGGGGKVKKAVSESGPVKKRGEVGMWAC